MWALLSRRFRRWLFMAIALPLGAWLLDKLGRSVEQRRGESGLSRGLRGSSDYLRQGRGSRPNTTVRRTDGPDRRY